MTSTPAATTAPAEAAAARTMPVTKEPTDSATAARLADAKGSAEPGNVAAQGLSVNTPAQAPADANAGTVQAPAAAAAASPASGAAPVASPAPQANEHPAGNGPAASTSASAAVPSAAASPTVGKTSPTPTGTVQDGTAAATPSMLDAGAKAAGGTGPVDNRLASLALVSLGLLSPPPAVNGSAEPGAQPVAPGDGTSRTGTISEPTLSARSLGPGTTATAATIGEAAPPLVDAAGSPPLPSLRIPDPASDPGLVAGSRGEVRTTVLPESIPEPSTMAVGLLAVAYLALQVRARRRHSARLIR
ncbi:MAG: hypothetical protein U0790_29410 [Isosphaeraceae bacterium]